MGNLYSFVLPAYKARFFREAIDSILAQTYTNFELIIVNDASPEDLDTIAYSYNDSRIKYYKNEQNIGGNNLVAQWNHCLSYATGEYVILASDDDVYFPHYLEKMDAMVEKYPSVNLFRPRTQLIDDKGDIICVNGLLSEFTSPLEFAYMKNMGGKGIPFYVFNRRELLSMGGFINYPLAWYSDDATIICMANKGVVFFNEILFSFRHSGESITTKRNNLSTLRFKILATESYYQNLPVLLSQLKEFNPMDSWFRNQILKMINRDKVNDLRAWIECSTKWASVRCIPLLIQSKIFSVGMLLRIYVKQLLLNK